MSCCLIVVSLLKSQYASPYLKLHQHSLSLSLSFSVDFLKPLNHLLINNFFFIHFPNGWLSHTYFFHLLHPLLLFINIMMNETTVKASDGFLGSSNIGGFGYGIGVSVGILILITTITLASYFCTRGQQQQQTTNQRSNNNNRGQNDGGADHNQSSIVIDVGLDESTIKSYPKLPYSEARLQKKDSTATCCSICLADYRSSDMLRLLPDCSHLFHVKCVDPWLRLHPTCPVCRTSPLPTPLSTPLAEVVPLAARTD